VLLRSQRERIHVDTGIGGTGVVLEGLNDVKVRTLSLRDTVLAVKLELSGNNGVLTPAVEVEGSLSKHEGAGIRDSGAGDSTDTILVENTSGGVPVLVAVHRTARDGIGSTGHLENTSGDEGIRTRGLSGTAEGVDRGRKDINGIGVVEGLGTEDLEESTVALKGGAIVNVGIGLDNPDELLAGVVEVDLDLVRRRSNGLITSVLELLNEVLVGVLGELSALVSIQEDEINIDRGGNKGLLVGSGDGKGSGTSGSNNILDSPQALTNRSEVNVNLDLVVLEGNQRKSKTGVLAKPEEKRNVEGGLRKSLSGGANLAGASSRSTRAVDVSEGRVSHVSELSGVADHLVVASLLLRREGKLIPDVHPVTILAVNSLATNLNLNLGDQLLTGVVQPTGIDITSTGVLHALVNLGESNLDIGAVSHITVSGDGARNTATEVSLAVESLLNRLHGEVGVASVRHLPVSNLGVSCKENILCAIGD
jgi:hypothetical protein